MLPLSYLFRPMAHNPYLPIDVNNEQEDSSAGITSAGVVASSAYSSYLASVSMAFSPATGSSSSSSSSKAAGAYHHSVEVDDGDEGGMEIEMERSVMARAPMQSSASASAPTSATSRA
jgi:hypothetical protein